MKNKYTRNELLDMKPLTVYKLVLNGNIKTFPKGFWHQSNSREISREFIKYLLEEHLKWTDEEIKNKLNTSILRKYKLRGMLGAIYNDSQFSAISEAYPNKFKAWEFSSTPQNFWNKETGYDAVKWLLEDKLKWNDEDIKKKYSVAVFKKYNLTGMLTYVFNSSPFLAINTVYPNKFKPWEFSHTAPCFWNIETATSATKWLIEDKLKWNDEDIKNKLSYKVFKVNGLAGMLVSVFDGSPFNAFNVAYPNKFKPWEFKKVPCNYWSTETGIKAVKWLIEDKLKWNDEDIKKNFNKYVFDKYGLTGMLTVVFKTSPFLALNTTYPNRFTKKDLYGYRNKE